MDTGCDMHDIADTPQGGKPVCISRKVTNRYRLHGLSPFDTTLSNRSPDIPLAICNSKTSHQGSPDKAGCTRYKNQTSLDSHAATDTNYLKLQ